MLPAGISKFDQVLANHGQLARVAGIRSFTVRELDGSGAFGVKGNLTPIKERLAIVDDNSIRGKPRRSRHLNVVNILSSGPSNTNHLSCGDAQLSFFT